MPLISMIVPVYNVEDYLSKCIDSILAQTFKDFELILIDDGSTDNCGSICDEYALKDNRVKVIHKKNGGVSSARNTALDIAKGEYITFCDSDDYIDSDWLEYLYCGIVQKNTDSYSANFRCVDENGKVLMSSSYKEKFTEFCSKDKLMQYVLMDILEQKCGWAVCTRIFKKSIIDKYCIRFCETCGNYAEDLGFVLEYTLNCRSARTEEYCGYNYYQRSNSMMHNSENIIKLNETNEVAFHVAEFINQYHNSSKIRKYLPLIFWRIMQNEYIRMLQKKILMELPQKISIIQNKKWYNKMNRKVIKSYFMIKKLFGKDCADRTFIIATFCLHKNINIFRVQTKIYYKLKGF